MLTASQRLILEVWLVAALVLVGWGALVRWLWREPAGTGADDLLQSFWLGWATVLLVLQIWHLAWAVDGRARMAVAIIGGAGLLLGRTWRPAWRILRRLPVNLPAVALALLLAVWLSNRAVDGSHFGDTGGYYAPTIRWVREYPAVIGLANLYPPYAYHQSYFLYAALLEWGVFVGSSYHLLNSLLLMALAARSALGLWRLLRRAPHGAVDCFFALLLPAEVDAALGFLFTSPAPDFGVFAIGIALFAALLALLTCPARERRLHFLSLALLAAVAPTVKLPATGLAAAGMLVGAGAWIRRTRPQWRRIAGGLGIAALLGAMAIGPWIAGNVLLSGLPFFPAHWGAPGVEWEVTWDVQQWIQNTMFIGDWRVAIRQPAWLAQRFVAMGWTARDVATPLLIAAAALPIGVLGAAVRLARRRPRADDGLSAWILLPPFASLAFCIATTPVPRYAGATAWLIAVSTVMLALRDGLRTPLGGRFAALAAVALAAVPFALGAQPWLELHEFPPNPVTPVERQQTASGLEVYLAPPTNQSCWNAPLPCTPRLQPGLRLRRPPDLGSGFLADRVQPAPQ